MLAAAEEGGRGRYMRFLNYLINDCIYLLDESLKKLPDVKEAENLRDDPVRWAALGPRGQEQHSCAPGDDLFFANIWLDHPEKPFHFQFNKKVFIASKYLK